MIDVSIGKQRCRPTPGLLLLFLIISC